MNVVFFGSSKYVIPIIKILQKNFDLKLVLTTEKNTTGVVPSYCIKNKIPYQSVSSLSDPDLKSLILNLKSDVGILADFGLIIPKEILNAFPKGIINIHPSLLPKYRGPTPVQTAILNGEKTTGVSIIKLDEQIDHGPILMQIEEKILPQDTGESLYGRLFNLGAGSIVQTIELYLNKKIKPRQQDHEKATFTKPLIRTDGYVDLSLLKIENLKLKIRAYYPWPGVWTKLNLKTKDKRSKIIKFLPGNLIQVEGKKPVNYKDFLNGYNEAKYILEKLKLSNF